MVLSFEAQNKNKLQKAQVNKKSYCIEENSPQSDP